MSRDGELIGVNWGSSRFRAYRIAADGAMLDEVDTGQGIATLDRAGMAAAMTALATRWPGAAPIWASGMVGSNIGWADVPYAAAPAGAAALAGGAAAARIGEAEVRIVPGVACRRAADDAPDVMRGEEVELLGLATLEGTRDGVVVLPGTHSKWVRLADGGLSDFFTSMSGEIIDRLTTQGLLASIVEGEADCGAAFDDGLEQGFAGEVGLATALFGARARVMRGRLERRDTASYLRGLLIGAELRDAGRLIALGAADRVAIIGNAALTRLYARALEWLNIATHVVSSREACIAGFRALDRAARP